MILSKIVSGLAVFAGVLLGLWGSSQVAHAQGRAYVGNFGSDSVSVLDTSSNTVVATVKVGVQPFGVAITPDGTRVYVANCGGDVFVIATSNNAVLAKVVVGGCPTGVAITPDGSHVYVTKDNANAVAVIATSSNTVVATIAVGPAPGGVAITPDGKHAYVTNVGTGTGPVSVIDTSSNSVVTTVNLGNVGPVGVAITPDGTRAYVLDGLGSLSIISTASNTVTGTVSLAGNDISPFGLAITPDGTRAYVTRFAANSVAVIDLSSNAVTAMVAMPGFPNGLTITPDGTRVYVAISPDASGLGTGSVVVLDTSSNTLVTTVAVGTTPYGMAILAGSGTSTLQITKVANAEGESPTIAPNTWTEIKGSNLAPAGDSRIWQTSDFINNQMPTALDGVSVTVNGKNAFVWYISPGQVNILTPPDSMQGTVNITLNNGSASTSSTAKAAALSPSFFVFDGTHVIAAHLNGTDVGPSTLYPGLTTPAKPGETIVVFANGFGPTSPPVVSGSPVQAGTLSPLPVVKIGGVAAAVQFAGLVFPGGFQFNVTVPPGTPDGDQPIVATYNGATTQSNTVLTVQR